MSALLTEIDARGVARLTLNGPDRHNAPDDYLVADPMRAMELGLVQEVVPGVALAEERDCLIEALLRGAPGAQGAAKRLIFLCENRAVDAELGHELARRIAARRASKEGQEGMAAFIEK